MDLHAQYCRCSVYAYHSRFAAMSSLIGCFPPQGNFIILLLSPPGLANVEGAYGHSASYDFPISPRTRDI